MATTPRIEFSQAAIADFCQRWRIAELSLFGSVLREDFGPGSDVDILVRFEPESRHTLFDMVRMQDELQAMLGRPVDLVSKRAVEESRNTLRREAILNGAEILYAA